MFVNYVGVRSEDGAAVRQQLRRRARSRSRSAPGGVIQGWEQGLVGATAGERLQLDIPSDLAYGDQPQGDVIQAGDALSFVIDVLAVVPPTDPADEPTRRLPDVGGAGHRGRASRTCASATGATLEAGQTGLFHLVVARGDDGTVLQSTWATGSRSRSPIAEGELGRRPRRGLVGMQVGGRRVVTIPSDARTPG